MTISSVRKIGGSLYLRVPVDIADQLGIQAKSKLDACSENGSLIFRAVKPAYSLAQMLEETDVAALQAANALDPDWISGEPVGREIL